MFKAMSNNVQGYELNIITLICHRFIQIKKYKKLNPLK